MHPAKELPLNNSVQLELEPGLESELGPKASIQKRTAFSFDTFPEFRFLGIYCLSQADDEWTLIPFDKPLPAQTRCDPLRSTAMAFSAPVINDEVKRHVTLDPDLAGGRKDYDPWENHARESQLTSPHEKGRHYLVWFPELLKAYQSYRLLSPAKSLADEFGRTLEGAIEMSFKTAHRRPNIKLIHPRAVLECLELQPDQESRRAAKIREKRRQSGRGRGADLGLRSLFKFVSYWNPRPDLA